MKPGGVTRENNHLLQGVVNQRAGAISHCISAQLQPIRHRMLDSEHPGFPPLFRLSWRAQDSIMNSGHISLSASEIAYASITKGICRDLR
ncbi:hypothetical protein KCP75_00975 [Salmonella enterica subsp. enterica]|nr:hypothetical protein KCP75_00975 [Salmonella enterica subsp. enterica]